MLKLKQHFQNKHGNVNERDLQRAWFIKAREDRERKEQLTQKMEDDLAALGTEVIMATSVQINKFEAKLDLYDTATVEALMVNQEKIEAVQERMELLLSQAYVIDDGRRVFKTEDGTKVFDEHGTEIGTDDLDPTLIDDNYPSWESFKAEKDELDTLRSERVEILEYQQHLDDTRDRLADGDITEAELDELDAELSDLMPASVRVYVPGMEAKPESNTLPEQAVERQLASQSQPEFQTIGMP